MGNEVCETCIRDVGTVVEFFVFELREFGVLGIRVEGIRELTEKRC